MSKHIVSQECRKLSRMLLCDQSHTTKNSLADAACKGAVADYFERHGQGYQGENETPSALRDASTLAREVRDTTRSPS